MLIIAMITKLEVLALTGMPLDNDTVTSVMLILKTGWGGGGVCSRTNTKYNMKSNYDFSYYYNYMFIYFIYLFSDIILIL